jgi:SAM-dependent methyltransferase
MSDWLRRLKHFGFRRYCPACGSNTRRFEGYGIPSRPDAKCPVCGSSERERAQVLLLKREVLPGLAKTAPFRVLHIAPERGVARTLQSVPDVEYVSGDIEPGRAMKVVDLTKPGFADASFDLIFLSHVLEHIEDDRLALREIERILAPTGKVFVEVPVLARTTYEDATLRSPEERLAAFGQVDHVRLCGLDYRERLTEAGFDVKTYSVEDYFDRREIEHMRLLAEPVDDAAAPPRRERLYSVAWLCSKPAAGSVQQRVPG